MRLRRVSGSDPTRFVGREQELSALRLLYESAQSGRAGFAMVQGPPGMGKTTLLNHLLDGLNDACVVRANGVEPESDLEFGVVDQLLREAGATPAGLPGGDHLRAGTLLLEAIDALETRTPVVVAIEDCHWVDQSSLRAVLFAVRRMVSERVLCVLTLRPEGLDRLPTGLRALAERYGGVTVRLEPLTDDEVRLLAAARDTPISARAIRRLHEHTGGSPLYASALLDEVPADRWDTFEERWPAPRSYAALVQRRVAALTPAARDLLQSCSVLGVSCSVDMASMLCEVDRPLEAVEEAAHTGLLTFDHATADQLRFDHPLSRVAVYHGIGLATRARLHTRAASLMGSPFEALRHRVAATAGADDNLATELEQSAAAASSTGAWSTVASLLAYASRLSSDAAERGRRLLEAGEAALYSSERERVRRLLPVLEQLEPSSLRDGVLAFAAITNGRGDDAERLLASAWSLCNPERDGLLAAKICERRAFLGVLRMRPSEAVEWGSRAVELSPDNDVTVSLSTWTLALGLDQTGRRDEALALIDEGVVRLGAALRAGAYPLADVRGACLLAADRLVEAREALEVAAPLQVQHGVLTKASLAYSRLARVAFASGNWDDAVVHADVAIALADEADDPGPQAHARQVGMLVPAARKLVDEMALRHVELAELVVNFEDHRTARRLGLAVHAYAVGDLPQVLELLDPLTDLPDCHSANDPGYWRWHDLYVDTLIDTGDLDTAKRFIARYMPMMDVLGRPSMKAHLTRCHGRIAWAEQRRRESTEALENALDQIRPLSMPYDEARCEVAYAQVLRRNGSRRAAAKHLEAAKQRLELLGWTALLEQCETELAACGLAPVRRSHASSRDDLTPRERAVAQLAAAGHSNREIAAQLMLSVKTVENHLTHVFAKSGVRSRAGLGKALRSVTQSD